MDDIDNRAGDDVSPVSREFHMAVERSVADKAKALESAIAQITRQCGQGAIMRMGDHQAQKIDAIPTGSLGLDIALGIGGLPRGRIIEIYGPESSGKCLTADTHTLGSRGLLTIAELFEIEGYQTASTTKVIPHSVGLLNEKSSIEHTSHLTWNGRRPVYKMTTAIGNVLEPTCNHPVRIMDENGFVVWRNAGKISVTDHLVVMRDTECFPETDMLTTDEAILLGFLIADGSNKSEKRVAFSNGDPDVILEYKKLIEKFAPECELISYPKKKQAQ